MCERAIHAAAISYADMWQPTRFRSGETRAAASNQVHCSNELEMFIDCCHECLIDCRPILGSICLSLHRLDQVNECEAEEDATSDAVGSR